MNSRIYSEQNRLSKLTKLGDPLEKLQQINWEFFSTIINNAQIEIESLENSTFPYDSITMFKIFILQNIYNISDSRIEYQINDRLSFMRFLELNLDDKIPEEEVISAYRQKFKKNEVTKALLDLFATGLELHEFMNLEGIEVDILLKNSLASQSNCNEPEISNEIELQENNSLKHSEKIKLFVTADDLSCFEQSHKISTVTAYFDGIANKDYSININYCDHCKHYFIKHTEYRRLLYFNGDPVGLPGFSSSTPSKITKFIPYLISSIDLDGYTVSKSKKLSSFERKAKLEYVLNTGTISKSQIMQYLDASFENSKNAQNMQEARGKWVNDLIFVREFNKNSQRKVLVAEIVHIDKL